MNDYNIISTETNSLCLYEGTNYCLETQTTTNTTMPLALPVMITQVIIFLCVIFAFIRRRK